jgi:polyphosphate glucokinase
MCMNVLVIDIGGSHVKMLATGQAERRRFDSGPQLTPQRMVEQVRKLAGDWHCEAISIGYPGRVDHRGPAADTENLGPGWAGFDFCKAFGLPVKVCNDAVMQALGSYDGGRMLFLGLGTGLGSTLIAGKTIVPMELGNLPYGTDGTIADYVSKAGLARHGEEAWQRAVTEVVGMLRSALAADYVVLGGGNADRVQHLPPQTRRGHNHNAFVGGFRLWETTVVPLDHAPAAYEVWKVI